MVEEVILVNRKIPLTVLTLAVALLAAPYVGIVSAKPSTTVSGTIALVVVVPLGIVPKGKSDNQVMIMDLTEDWQGGIEGISTTIAIWMIHAGLEPGVGRGLNVHEKLAFESATVLGKSGSLLMELDIEAPDGHWTIIGGTGELANLRGHGTLTLATAPYSYTGEVHFEP